MGHRVIARASRVVFVALAAAWALQRWGGDASALAIVVAYAPRSVYLAPALAALALSLLARAPRALLLACASVALAVFPLGGLTLGRGTAAVAPGSFRIVQLNVAKWERGAPALAAEIERASPDVFCMEEAGAYPWLRDDQQQPEALARRLAAYRIERFDEILVGSRLPVVAARREALPPGPDARPLVEVVVRVGATEVSVVAAHLIPTLLGVASSRDRGALEASPLVAIAAGRRAQAERLGRFVAGLPRPVVVCADLNAQPHTAAATAAREGLHDAWAVAGSGFGFTSPAGRADTRIDYVLTRGLDARRVGRIDAPVSDHYGVWADLSLRESAPAR